MSAHPPMSKELSGSHCVIFQLHQPEFHHLERTILQHLSAWKLPGSFPRWLLGGSPWDGLWKVTLVLGQPAFCPPSTLACTHSYVLSQHSVVLKHSFMVGYLPTHPPMSKALSRLPRPFCIWFRVQPGSKGATCHSNLLWASPLYLAQSSTSCHLSCLQRP